MISNDAESCSMYFVVVVALEHHSAQNKNVYGETVNK